MSDLLTENPAVGEAKRDWGRILNSQLDKFFKLQCQSLFFRNFYSNFKMAGS